MEENFIEILTKLLAMNRNEAQLVIERIEDKELKEKLIYYFKELQKNEENYSEKMKEKLKERLNRNDPGDYIMKLLD